MSFHRKLIARCIFFCTGANVHASNTIPHKVCTVLSARVIASNPDQADSIEWRNMRAGGRAEALCGATCALAAVRRHSIGKTWPNLRVQGESIGKTWPNLRVQGESIGKTWPRAAVRRHSIRKAGRRLIERLILRVY